MSNVKWQVVGTSLNNVIKEYPLKAQAVAWCWLNGFVIDMGRYGYHLDGRVEIRKCNESDNINLFSSERFRQSIASEYKNIQSGNQSTWRRI